MRSLDPRHLVLSLLLALCLLPARAHAQSTALSDSAMLVVYDGSTVVAREEFQYLHEGDSLLVTATHSRTLLDAQGQRVPFEKHLLLVVDARDLGLRRYLSNQKFAGVEVVRGLLPEDTIFTYYSERDGAGDALRMTQPPGRLFVLDSGLFTLFDVLTRSVAGKTFATRRVQMIALSPDTVTTPVATLMRQPDDTLRVGRRTTRILRHYTFEEGAIRFELSADDQGRLHKLTHAESGLRVERLPDTPTADRPRRAGHPRR